MITVQRSDVSDGAAAMVRLDANTRHIAAAEEIKLLTARLVTLMEQQQNRGGEPARCANKAIDRFEEAAMWAVKAVTTGL